MKFPEFLTQFPLAAPTYETPVAYYQRMDPIRPTRHVEVYVSMPLTGGPRKSLIEAKMASLGIQMGEWDLMQKVIEANMRGIHEIAPLIFERFGGGTVTLPTEIGSGREHWTQQDYNLLWSLYVAGVTPEAAWDVVHQMPQFSRYLTLKGEIPSTQRHEAYRTLRSELLAIVNRTRGSRHTRLDRPVGHVVQMPGYEQSHGATNEGELATALGVKRSKIVFNSAAKEIQRLGMYDPLFVDPRYSRPERRGPAILLERLS